MKNKFLSIAVASNILFAAFLPLPQQQISTVFSCAAGETVKMRVINSQTVELSCEAPTIVTPAPTAQPTSTPIPTVPPPVPTLPPTQVPPTQVPPTQVPPTQVPPTLTSVPTATSIPVGQGPTASTPLCPSHNQTVWHALYDLARDCHYDHEHGVNPNGALSLATFGPVENFYGGQQIGYVWQTTGENILKHEGYHVNSAANMPCEQQNYLYLPESKRNCITDFRITLHDYHATFEGTSRFHSFGAEVRSCSRDGVCGIIRTGGLNDTGDAHIPYKTDCVNIPGANRPPCPPLDVWDYQRHSPPYWSFTRKVDAIKNLNNGYLCRNISCQNLPGNFQNWENLSADRTDSIGNREGAANHLLHMNVRTHNAAATYNSATGKFEYVCPSGSCLATGDAVYVYAIVFDVPANLAVGGVVNYTGYTNRAGNIVNNCSAPGPECVPLSIKNLKPGTYIYDMTEGFIPGLRVWGDGLVTQGARYFDTTPAGLNSWISLK